MIKMSVYLTKFNFCLFSKRINIFKCLPNCFLEFIHFLATNYILNKCITTSTQSVDAAEDAYYVFAEGEHTTFIESPGYYTNPHDGEVRFLDLLYLWKTWSTSSLPLPGVEILVTVPCVDTIWLINNLHYLKKFKCVQINE